MPQEPDPEQKIFLLIDGHALIYRAFYAFPNLTDPQGKLVNAVYGFCRILLSAINDFTPQYAAVTFDHPKPTFRHQEFDDYKAHRPEMPDELKPQIAIIKEVVEALNLPQFELAGYEADDLIGTINYKLDNCPDELGVMGGLQEQLLTVVVTGDKDLLQLVDDSTHVWLPGRGRQPDREYDQAAVKQDLGIRPDQVVDFKALMGDSSDNIPGIKGVGQKTATKLLHHADSLKKLYELLEKPGFTQDEVLKGALLKKLKNNKEQAFLSQKLAKIEQQVPLELNLGQCQVNSYDKAKVVELFQALDFKSLIKMLPSDQFEQDIQEALF